ncbi:efflux RND transporter permease subunit [Marinobacterium sp. YM272]|uniref:efflux RND transporter permease subunit n=1 Tax=Marinobacterium sp. YM272 TaxID=3421654 RepID=UPI003D7F8BED
MQQQPASGHGFLSGLITLFTTHRVAANLLMALMIIAGLFSIKKLNVQFFPTFELDVLTVQVSWRGSTAEDVERSILLPLEEELRSLDGIDQIISTARDGVASVRIELTEDTDVDYALSEAKQKVDAVRGDLPDDVDEPLVQRVTRYDSIADLIITSDRASLEELRTLARQYEQELLASGIRKIDFVGLPDQELAIQLSPEELSRLGMTFDEVVANIQQRSIDLPAGTAAQNDGSRQLRSLGQQRDVRGFEQLPLLAADEGQLLRLGDIALIERRAADDQVLLSYQGQPAILLELKRTENDDSLVGARIFNQWLEATRPTLSQGVELIPYQERWQLIQDRIDLLLKNGLSGLVLVVAILFLFLNGRVALWVTVGIPVSFMATLAILYAIGGTINMISLFGLIMALGIIVDDAIVVGEDTLTHAQMGEASRRAAIGGALRMKAPVIASSMTTIAAFLPLLLVGGIIGNIMGDIPTVVICVILASLVECFLVLPGHLYHSLHRTDAVHPSRLRERLDAGFNHFRDQMFRPFVERAIRFRWTAIALAIGLLIISIGLVAGGRLKFTFFPSVEQDTLNANVQFAAGSDISQVRNFIEHLRTSLDETDQALGGDQVKMSLARLRTASFSRAGAGNSSGDEFGVLSVELYPSDDRGMTTSGFIREWRERIRLPAGIERFSIDVSQGGPPGKPIEVKLTGPDLNALKSASLQLQRDLKGYSGLYNVDDDLPFGTSQLIYSLTPAGEAAGLSLQQVGRQLRSAFDGAEVQTFYEGQDQIEVRVMLPDRVRKRLGTLEQLPIVLPDGSVTPLTNVVDFTARRGFDSLQRIDGQLAINVSADLNENQTNANEVIESLRQEVIPGLSAEYGVSASFEGKNRDQRETLADMQLGLVIALALIYIILAWVFASYSWPLTVMLAIPLGITGALLGHFITGQTLTVLSLFGVFGLSGIVINDSIVLVTFYKQLRAQGLDVHDAVVEAACQRLRAVLLTSLTTIGGLTPILFETSLQAQFLIPMATSIVFGLAYGTLLILVVVPSMLTILEGARERLGLRPREEHEAVTAPE